MRNLRHHLDDNPRLKALGSYVVYRREAMAKLTKSRPPVFDSPAFFTTAKCASTFISKAFSLVERYYGLKAYNFAGLYWNTGNLDVYGALQRDADRLFTRSRALYGPLRDFVDLPGMSRRPLVLMLRDPRDVLVSAYYSVAFSHALPGGTGARERFLAKRKQVRETSVDQFVLDHLEEYIKPYEKYAKCLLNRSNLTFLTYEELTSDISAWSESFLRGLGLSSNPDVLARLSELYADGKPAAGSSDVNSHRRSGVSGQWRTLAPATQERLNLAIGPLLASFEKWPA